VNGKQHNRQPTNRTGRAEKQSHYYCIRLPCLMSENEQSVAAVEPAVSGCCIGATGRLSLLGELPRHQHSQPAQAAAGA